MKIEEIEKILEFLRAAEKLKTVKRDNYLSNGELESDADHSWMMGMMAVLLAGKMENEVDLAKVLALIIVHDLAEAEAGDVPLFKQIGNDEVKRKKRAAETAAMEMMIGILPEEAGGKIRELWEEYEAQETAEAKFVKAIDKLEAVFQALCYKDIAYWGKYGDGKVYYDVVLNDRKKAHWEHEEILVAIGEILKAKTKERMEEEGIRL